MSQCLYFPYTNKVIRAIFVHNVASLAGPDKGSFVLFNSEAYIYNSDIELPSRNTFTIDIQIFVDHR